MEVQLGVVQSAWEFRWSAMLLAFARYHLDLYIYIWVHHSLGAPWGTRKLVYKHIYIYLIYNYIYIEMPKTKWSTVIQHT